jgi:phosphopantetheine adenylyltransferase
MNDKVAKELRKMIKEEMPAILESELNKGQHAKLAEEMKQIIKEIVPSILTDVQFQNVYQKVSAEVKERLDNIDKYIKETNELRAKKLEETLTAMMEKQAAKTE